MTSHQLDEEAIFHVARKLDDLEYREIYLNQICADDQKLRARVEALLGVHEQEQGFLQSASPTTTIDQTPLTEQSGTSVGRYKLLQQIGEGGMGTVFMAEQTRPVTRRVALKIIKAGMDSKSVIARFEAERQALALMDHPNIAKVLDAGTTDSGRPYFVMELVKGVPITEYCDDNKLTVWQRLELFIEVCKAIQHAHQKGIIHRDIKPSNVLVALYDGKPVPKIIDFGVAKATSQRLTERTMFTQYGQIVGTLEYMSPEQAQFNQLDVDTRSDIYSLGVLLYELLTGVTPFDRERLRASAFEELLRILREEEPPKPSTKISTLGEQGSTVAHNRRIECKKLGRAVQGDLDWIVMKSLEKDRTRRYPTANALINDVLRHLAHEPIHARAPSFIYRTRKLLYRRRAAVAVFASLFVLLITIVAIGFYAYESRLNEMELVNQRQKDMLRRHDVDRAHEQIPAIHRLVDEGRVVQAFRLASQWSHVLGDDPTLTAVWNEISVPRTVETSFPGAEVRVCDSTAPESMLFIGETPLLDVRLPLGTFRARIDKAGFSTVEQLWTVRSNDDSPIDIELHDDVPKDMIPVSGSEASIFGSVDFPSIDKFLIDKHEVTNRAFKAFVDTGGYSRREYWEHEFIEDGERIDWAVAMKRFCDRTGLPGPAEWENGGYRAGEDEFPVRGISWYEAAAYAKSVGKQLPTIYHRGLAAAGRANQIIPLSNFIGKGVSPVGAYKGISQCGAYDMAGNVKEWCWNQTSDDKRWVLGGAWNEPTYTFVLPDAASPFSRLETIGFRCVKYSAVPNMRALAATDGRKRDYTNAQRVPQQELDAYLLQYAYDKNSRLNAVTVQRDDILQCRYELVEVDAAYRGEKLLLHLFLPPPDYPPPYKGAVWFPGLGAINDGKTGKGYFDRGGNEGSIMRGLVERGQAVCLPAYKGTFERTGGFKMLEFGRDIVKTREHIVDMVKDVARAVDYLETRVDIRSESLIYIGYSLGGMLGPVANVVERRFRGAVWILAGFDDVPFPPDVDPFTFADSVELPVLMLNGRYDMYFPIDSSQMALFHSIQSRDKSIEHYDTPHRVPIEDALNEIGDWLGRFERK